MGTTRHTIKRQPLVGKITRNGWWLIVAALVAIVAIIFVMTVPTHRTYTFVDNFNGPAGSAPDPAKWSYDLGGGGWGNDELQDYTNSRMNSFLDGRGNLVIRATRQENSYSSARLHTAGKFSQKHGHWEMRAKIDSRSGFWPAWWMLGNNLGTVGWPRCGELDMVEDYGFSAVESSVHTGTAENALRSTQGDIENDTDWHVWSTDWTPRGITFSRDGVKYYSYTWNRGGHGDSVPSPDQPMFMLLNLAVGGHGTGNVIPSPDAFPVDFVIDYVKVSA